MFEQMAKAKAARALCVHRAAGRSPGSAISAPAVHSEMPAITRNRLPKPLALTNGPSAHTASELKPSDSVSRRPATRERMLSST